MSFHFRVLAITVAMGFLAASAIADQPKSYRISIGSVSKIGAAEFQPGNYNLVVDSHDPKVKFTEVSSGKTIELEAKVEVTDRKFDSTQIYSIRSDGTNRITEIRIGGSKTRVGFN